jgi:UrcA family protein
MEQHMSKVTAGSGALSRVAAALGACLIIGAATSAFAGTPAEPPASVRVSYHDLNLSTDTGSQALYARIVAAARQVCPVSDIRNLSEVAAAQACRTEAIARAVREVNSPRLASLSTAHLRQG